TWHLLCCADTGDLGSL
ncbi:hypothetical protein D018_4980B, partial [Vibrio parahaemolyticus VP2007-007]